MCFAEQASIQCKMNESVSQQKLQRKKKYPNLIWQIIWGHNTKNEMSHKTNVEKNWFIQNREKKNPLNKNRLRIKHRQRVAVKRCALQHKCSFNQKHNDNEQTLPNDQWLLALNCFSYICYTRQCTYTAGETVKSICKSNKIVSAESNNNNKKNCA